MVFYCCWVGEDAAKVYSYRVEVKVRLVWVRIELGFRMFKVLMIIEGFV